MNCESTVLSLMTALYGPEAEIDDDVRVGRREPDHVHRLVLLAGGQAVDDVGRRERLAVRPLDAVLQVEREGLVPVRPLPALREPRIQVAAAGDRADDQRLVEGAAHEAAARQAGGGVGLKFLTKAGSPEPVMTRHEWPACAVAPAVGAAGADALDDERGHCGEAREREDYAPGVERTSRRIVRSFLARGRVEAETTGVVPATFPVTLLHSSELQSQAVRSGNVVASRSFRNVPERASMAVMAS